MCREIRQHGSDIAILMLTAKTQIIDRVIGLKLEADDYLTDLSIRQAAGAGGGAAAAGQQERSDTSTALPVQERPLV